MSQDKKHTNPTDCPNCDGTGWTEEGWKRAFPNGFSVDDGINPFDGDCEACHGTGRAAGQ